MLHFNYLAGCMSLRPFILSCSAFFLILIFSLKSGAGLFLHNFFHTGNSANETPLPGDNKSVNYTCTCIDDFLAPYDETGGPVCSSPFSNIISAHSFFKDPVLFYTPVCLSLRGPPAKRLY